ncbi:hypothetical protein [Bradyrhizobium cajani]|uniref:hypothetical protein n=1 Tax=Bradyrhizobium cajani TaxID=1928661 RepID=UPI001FE6A9B3|nr:hypothetical protein [Bradyrhizobium cajani]MCP3371098.1 hypothetical protein [Bradyrhizobium cajani]
MGKGTSEGGTEALAGTAPSAAGWLGAIALIGFILVATAQACIAVHSQEPTASANILT